VNSSEITGLINAWQSGDDDALDDLMPHIYSELHRIANRQMRGESNSHTLQATALVNEAFVRLANVEISYEDRSHFLAMAARTMRRVLVDHARRKKSAKRGGSLRDLTFDDAVVGATVDNPTILELNLALTELAEFDEGLANTVELVFFGGLSYAEAASALGQSKTAIFDNMRLAKAWLKNYMADMEPAP